MFVATVGSEVSLFYPVYQLLTKRGIEVLNISTGKLCCDKEGEIPDVVLKKYGMEYKSLLDYKTLNVLSVLKQEKPNMVVLFSDQEYVRRAFVYAAKGLRIPTLLFQLGMSSNKSNIISVAIKRTAYRIAKHFWNILHKYLYLLRTMVVLKWSVSRILREVFNDFKIAVTINDNRCTYGCDYIAIAGKWEEDTLLKRGVKEKQIIITGNPLLNFNLSATTKDLRTELNINEDKVILFLTSSMVEHGQWTIERRSEFVNTAIDAISPLLDKAKLVIKIHPVENLEDYQEILANRKENIILRKGSLYDAIAMSDLIIVGGYSTSILESSAFHKPVILLNIYNEIKDVLYVELGLAEGVYNISELKPKAEALLYDKDIRNKSLDRVQSFLDNNKEFIDGKADERITDLITGVIK